MSQKTVFVSYRRDALGMAFARSIQQSLTTRGYDVFFDVDSLDAGKWEDQILSEVPRRAHFLLLLTPGALDRCGDANDWVRREFLTALEHGRNIVPVKEESVDLDVIRRDCPDAVKRVFDYQIASITHGSFDADLETLTRRYIAPHQAPRHSPDPVDPATKSCSVDISRIIKYAPERLIGRETETALLEDSWQKVVAHEEGRPHVLGFVALGGEGKTSLVAKWLAGMAGKDWPGCESVFAWSFYSQGSREQVAVSSDLFLAEALKFFGDPEMAGSAQGAYEKGQRLAELIGGRRSLLILDGVEPLQYPPSSPTGSRLKDQGVEALLKGLAASSNGLCIVTTRYSLPDLAAFVGSTWHEEELRRLSREAGVALLKAFGVKGSEHAVVGFCEPATASQRPSTSDVPRNENPDPLNEYEQLVEDVKGHALTLQLLGSYLRDAHDGDIRCRDRIKLEEADAEEQGGHAFRVLDAYVISFERGTAGDTPQQREAAKRALALLQLLGLFDRPATADCLEALWTGDVIPDLTEPLIGISDEQRRVALQRLEAGRLITINREKSSNRLASVDSHPLIREYFARRLRNTNGVAGVERSEPPVVDADSAGGSLRSTPATHEAETSEVWRAAHRRLYEHLCETTNEGDQPTLEELQPLYQAVEHGCHAGVAQKACDDIYFARIIRRNEEYSWRKLGAFCSDLGAVACFFEPPWTRVTNSVTEADQAWLLNEAAFKLRGLGRLTEALEPMRAALEMAITQENWKSAAVRASNLSELELTLGEVSGALSDAERSVTYADRSGDAFTRMGKRTTHADALHQSGRRSEAESLFREAEQMQAERQPAYPLLYSLQGFRYCDLLLALAEREAWRVVLRGTGFQPVNEQGSHGQDGRGTCRDVTDRANKMFEWRVPSDSLLDIALDHLTLSRAALYESLLSGSGFQPVTDSQTHGQDARATQSSEIEAAVSGLRRAGTQHELPRGLLTRAWQRSLFGRTTGPDSAQSNLDEAWEIAARGPMPLFMADIHLYRARLFGLYEPTALAAGLHGAVEQPQPAASAVGSQYPWQSLEHDLAEARRLIEKHGYGRRIQELEDAESALLKGGDDE